MTLLKAYLHAVVSDPLLERWNPRYLNDKVAVLREQRAAKWWYGGLIIMGVVHLILWQQRIHQGSLWAIDIGLVLIIWFDKRNTRQFIKDCQELAEVFPDCARFSGDELNMQARNYLTALVRVYDETCEPEESYAYEVATSKLNKFHLVAVGGLSYYIERARRQKAPARKSTPFLPAEYDDESGPAGIRAASIEN